MSFKEKANLGLNSTLNEFFKIISEKYNLNYNELQQIWSGSVVNNISPPQPNELEKLNKSELIEICRSKQLKVSGTRSDLVNRILDFDKQKSSTQPLFKQPSVVPPPVLKKLIEKIPPIKIEKNSFGNFVHKETSFVINEHTQKVYGKENKDGSINDLTSSDIDLCNKYKFSYVIPNNLDKKVDILDVKVDELDDDLEEELEEEEDDELLEEEEVEEEEEEEDYYEE